MTPTTDAEKARALCESLCPHLMNHTKTTKAEGALCFWCDSATAAILAAFGEVRADEKAGCVYSGCTRKGWWCIVHSSEAVKAARAEGRAAGLDEMWKYVAVAERQLELLARCAENAGNKGIPSSAYRDAALTMRSCFPRSAEAGKP